MNQVKEEKNSSGEGSGSPRPAPETSYCPTCRAFSVMPNHCDNCGGKLVYRMPDEGVPDFSDWTPYRAVKIMEGEYDIQSKNADHMFYVNGGAFAEWVCSQLNRKRDAETAKVD